jgi:uncharacterized protein
VKVSVVVATTHAADLVELDVAPGATVRDAIDASGLLARHPEIDLGRAADEQRIGVFARLVALDAVLAEGDRVELYRPLAVDPKEARRRRVTRRKR